MTQESDLSLALTVAYRALYGTEAYNFGKHGEIAEIVSGFSDAEICELFRYGKRKFNDNWNSSKTKKDGGSLTDFYRDWRESLGDPTGTRGSSRSITEVALWNAAKHWAKAAGWKVADFEDAYKGTREQPWHVFDEAQIANFIFDVVRAQLEAKGKPEAIERFLDGDGNLTTEAASKLWETRGKPQFDKEVIAETERRSKEPEPEVADLLDDLEEFLDD